MGSLSDFAARIDPFSPTVSEGHELLSGRVEDSFMNWFEGWDRCVGWRLPHRRGPFTSIFGLDTVRIAGSRFWGVHLPDRDWTASVGFRCAGRGCKISPDERHNPGATSVDVPMASSSCGPGSRTRPHASATPSTAPARLPCCRNESFRRRESARAGAFTSVHEV
jgi:hypothetical protein